MGEPIGPLTLPGINLSLPSLGGHSPGGVDAAPKGINHLTLATSAAEPIQATPPKESAAERQTILVAAPVAPAAADHRSASHVPAQHRSRSFADELEAVAERAPKDESFINSSWQRSSSRTSSRSRHRDEEAWRGAEARGVSEEASMQQAMNGFPMSLRSGSRSNRNRAQTRRLHLQQLHSATVLPKTAHNSHGAVKSYPSTPGKTAQTRSSAVVSPHRTPKRVGIQNYAEHIDHPATLQPQGKAQARSARQPSSSRGRAEASSATSKSTGHTRTQGSKQGGSNVRPGEDQWQLELPSYSELAPPQSADSAEMMQRMSPQRCSDESRQSYGGWPLLREGLEPIGPMLRSLEFQVGALFELMDAHSSRDEADKSVLDVIDRKKNSVMDCFDAVRDALWWQQRRQRDTQRQLAGEYDTGLSEYKTLQSQLARRIAAVVDESGCTELLEGGAHSDGSVGSARTPSWTNKPLRRLTQQARSASASSLHVGGQQPALSPALSVGRPLQVGSFTQPTVMQHGLDMSGVCQVGFAATQPIAVAPCEQWLAAGSCQEVPIAARVQGGHAVQPLQQNGGGQLMQQHAFTPGSQPSQNGVHPSQSFPQQEPSLLQQQQRQLQQLQQMQTLQMQQMQQLQDHLLQHAKPVKEPSSHHPMPPVETLHAEHHPQQATRTSPFVPWSLHQPQPSMPNSSHAQSLEAKKVDVGDILHATPPSHVVGSIEPVVHTYSSTAVPITPASTDASAASNCTASAMGQIHSYATTHLPSTTSHLPFARMPSPAVSAARGQEARVPGLVEMTPTVFHYRASSG